MIKKVNQLTLSERKLIAEIQKSELTDRITFYKYFWSGATNSLKFSFNYAKALEVIGSIYGNKNNNSSNYKRGVTYISEKLHISKSEVKVLRKNFKRFRKLNKYKKIDVYEYKIPYTIVKVISEIINSLEELKISEYFSSDFEVKYNVSKVNAIIEDVYKEINASAYSSNDEYVINIKNGLFDIDKVI